MSVAYFIARRYLRSNRRNRFLSFITNFAILGIMLGTAALIMTLSILDGFEREIKNKVVEFSAHIQITGYENLPLRGYAETAERLQREVPGLKKISPFVAKEGMIRFHDAVDGMFLKGIDSADLLTAPGAHLVEGRTLSQGTQHGHELLIGRKLALKLTAGVGDNVVLFALPGNQTGAARALQCTICGIYESGMSEFDDVYAYTHLSDAQSFLRMDGEVSGYDVLINDISRVDEVAKDLQGRLDYPHYVRTVFQLYRNLFSWVELQKKLSPILLCLIILVATFNIVGTLLMFVLEKTRAIGILKSLGAPPGLIRRIFIFQGMAIGLSGVVLGNLLAYALCSIQLHFRLFSLPSEIYYMDSVPIVMSSVNFAAVSFIALVLCLITTIVPSRAASSLHPVVALRFG